jgi:hypothetical protein
LILGIRRDREVARHFRGAGARAESAPIARLLYLISESVVVLWQGRISYSALLTVHPLYTVFCIEIGSLDLVLVIPVLPRLHTVLCRCA